MNYRVIFFTVTMALLVMGSVLFFVISIGAKSTQNQVLRQADMTGLDSDFVRKGLFAIGQPAYETQNHSCVAPFSDDAYATLVMDYHAVPRSCTVFVNGRLMRTERDLRPECIGECPYTDFDRTLYIGSLDTRDSHSVRVCCNDVCITKQLPAACVPA